MSDHGITKRQKTQTIQAAAQYQGAAQEKMGQSQEKSSIQEERKKIGGL
jgi:hypothetical protein